MNFSNDLLKSSKLVTVTTFCGNKFQTHVQCEEVPPFYGNPIPIIFLGGPLVLVLEERKKLTHTFYTNIIVYQPNPAQIPLG